MEQKKVADRNPLNSWFTILFLCGTMGLMPYFPEPHVWGKLRWISGGGVGMKLIDWGDFLMHGMPWILLLRLGIKEGIQRFKKN